MIIIFCLIYFITSLFWTHDFEFNEKIIIEKWDTIQKITDKLDTFDNLNMRWYLKNNTSDIKSLQLWSYIFSGTYTPKTLLQSINNGPTRSFSKITILEWRSIYDIDEYLTKQWYISGWEYISYVSDADILSSFVNKYPFIKLFIDTKPANIDSKLTLEGLLYPDTYHLNVNQPIIPQLVLLQLEAFNEKVFEKYQNQINTFSENLKSQWYNFKLWFYNIITLASIVEKEERNDNNKSLIAWIFLNRIQLNMRIDADITLCYWLKKWYEICTPSLIVSSINDENNIYNTRKRMWLTPTPIANSSAITILSVLNYQKTNNLFYLHDDTGKIRVAENLEWHNTNKNNHL